MRLDPNELNVESFAMISDTITPITIDTGPGGPDSLCYICYNTGNYVPTCKGYQCPIDPETRFPPCTNQLTCVGCA